MTVLFTKLLFLSCVSQSLADWPPNLSLTDSDVLKGSDSSLWDNMERPEKREVMQLGSRRYRKMQKLELASACKDGADIVLLIDSSGSINDHNPNNYDIYKDFLSAVVSKFANPNNKFAVVIFSDKAHVRQYLSTGSTNAATIALIKNLPYIAENTNLTGGLEEIHSNVLTSHRGDRPKAKNLVILLADGKQGPVELFNKDPAPIANALKLEKHAIIVTVGIASSYEVKYLEQISSSRDIFGIDSKRLTHQVNTFANLEKLPEHIHTSVCPPEEDPAPCLKGLDILIMIDASGTFDACSEAQLRAYVSMALQVVSTRRSAGTRFALIVYAFETYVLVKFNTNNNRQTTISQLQRLQWLAGTERLSNALSVAAAEVFTPENGDRKSFRNKLLLFSNGDTELSTGEPADIVRQVEKLKLRMVQIVTVSTEDAPILNSISSDGKIILAYLADLLGQNGKSTLEEILWKLCEQQKISATDYLKVQEESIDNGFGTGVRTASGSVPAAEFLLTSLVAALRNAGAL